MVVYKVTRTAQVNDSRVPKTKQGNLADFSLQV